MRVLGIDPSLTSCGMVLLEDGKLLRHAAIRPKQRGTARLLELREALLDFLPAELAVLEGYSYRAPFSRGGRAFELGELGGVLKAELALRGIEVLVVSPTQRLKFITGYGGWKGKASKEVVRQKLIEQYGWAFDTDDESDAAALSLIGWTLATREISTLPKHQADVLLQLQERESLDEWREEDSVEGCQRLQRQQGRRGHREKPPGRQGG